METLNLVVATLIRAMQAEVHPHTVLVPRDDFHVIESSPSIILQGPTLVENRCRRTQATFTCKDLDALTYTRHPYPRLYHLDFDVIITAAKEAQLISLQERVTQFILNHPVLAIEDRGSLCLTELTPVGGLQRVNLSNLKQGAGRLRIEDCPIFGNAQEEGCLISERVFEFRGDLLENLDLTNAQEEP